MSSHKITSNPLCIPVTLAFISLNHPLARVFVHAVLQPESFFSTIFAYVKAICLSFCLIISSSRNPFLLPTSHQICFLRNCDTTISCLQLTLITVVILYLFVLLLLGSLSLSKFFTRIFPICSINLAHRKIKTKAKQNKKTWYIVGIWCIY